MKKNTLPIIILIVTIAAVGTLTFYPRAKSSAELDAFAQCLAEKQVTMYGAYWCSHCQNEKKRFGDSFRFVPYVECTEETDKCIAEKINGYPTWVFPASPAGGPDPLTNSGQAVKRFEGEMGLERLSLESGCLLP